VITVHPRDKASHPFNQPTAVPPRVVIYSENGSTGEDLEACLEGPFRVVVATGLSDAVDALGDPAAVLLVVPADDPDSMDDWSMLLHRALIRDCRVMVLGPTGTTLKDSFNEAVSTYPDMPDPARLHRDLKELMA
jgi:hypothetical protein